METKMIGNKIAEARKKMNISQAELAQSVFVSPQAVGKWERGKSLPDIITLNRLAEVVGVDLNYFSGGVEAGAIEIKSPEPSVQQPAELKTGKQKDKVSWDMSRGNWVDADFSGLKNLHEKFASSNMKNCKFNGSAMSGLLLKSNSIDNCDFSNSDISDSQIRNSHLVNNLFIDCSLKGAEFSGSHIKGCDFSGADLNGVVFKSCDFQKNTMANAILNGTSFNGTQLDDMVFDGTLNGCYFENCAFARVTFQNATLTNTFFKGNNLKRIRFVNCKADNLTYAFLKAGKADLEGITLLIV